MVGESWRRAAYWLTSGATALLFAVPGCALVAGVAQFQSEMARLGYPNYFLLPFGVLKIVGAAAILAPRFPRLKEWAYAGMTLDAAFAAYSRAAVGDSPPQILLPLAIGALALASRKFGEAGWRRHASSASFQGRTT
jgi:uncharacterized membrane protein YphA (DoxX/SURF4 family)